MAELPQAIAVIPARGGSKRIPRKNIRWFEGRPMIAYSITAARESGVFRRILVSTDDEEIAAVARAEGAETPFLRPPEISDDKTGVAAVLDHALRAIRDEEGAFPATVCLIYATAPFLRASDLREAHQLLQQADTDAVCSATTFPFPIFRAFARRSDGTLAYQWPEYRQVISQDLPEMLHDAGQFVLVKTLVFQKDGLIPTLTRPLLLPRHRVQDIDTPEDWERAEWLYRSLRIECAT